MDPNISRHYIENDPLGIDADGNAPLSFIDWKRKKPGIIEKDSFVQYNSYILSWFDKNKNKGLSRIFLIKQKYLYLLNQLQLFFSEEEKNIWYEKINLADEKELLLSIPYFAKKLKTISLYYLRLRERLKNTKAKYNAIGSPISIVTEVRNFMLETFSNINEELPVSLQQSTPSFKELRETLVVDIEEIYDEHSYFDRSPDVSHTEYFNIFDKLTQKYYETKGIVLSSADWLFNSFSISTSADLDQLQTQLTGTFLELTDTQQYGSFIQNYLAENKYSLAIDPPPPIIEITDVPLQAGNNFFYYPYGITDTSVSISRRITPVPLSSLDLPTATAGSVLEQADTIFIKNGNETKAAWLYYEEFSTENKTVKASLNGNSSTSFIFPFPGYGLSGTNDEWSGPEFTTTRSYNFFPKTIKAAINEAYWSQPLGNDVTEPILLNNSSLVSSGAKSSIRPSEADKIYNSTPFTTDTQIPQGELSGAWLYEFKVTSLPILPEVDNLILWPHFIQNAEGTTNDVGQFPDYVNSLDFEDVCSPVSVHDLDNSQFVGAGAFEYANKIYKLEKFDDEINTALECSWLSASSETVNKIKYFKQDGVSLKLDSGNVTRFVWNGPVTEIESAFSFVHHQNDCPFVTNTPKVSAFEWEKCTCKQVYYSPFGHPGSTFEEHNSHCDYICEHAPNIEAFDLKSWTDTNGLDYTQSPSFAWYKTNEKREWGFGAWKQRDGSSSSMLLKPGSVYFYYRTNNKFQEQEFPSLVVIKRFEGQQNTKWIKAKKNEDGEWISADEESNMQIRPGDIIKIDRPNNTWISLSSTYEKDTSMNVGSIWSSIDYIALGSDLQTVTVSWPFDSVGLTQSPPVAYSALSAIISWKIESVEDPTQFVIIDSSYRDFDSQLLLIENDEIAAESVTQRSYINANFFTFTPLTTGLFAISVSAVATDQTFYHLTSSTIPLLSVVPLYKEEYQEQIRDFPSSGILLEHQLSGWDYIDGTNGAKPYWADLRVDKNKATKYKGIYSWGYQNDYVGEYLPLNAPTLSPLTLEYGNVIKYERVGDQFIWNQPIEYKTYVDQTYWKQLISHPSVNSNLSAIFKSQNLNSLEVIPSMSATDIILTNNNNGTPVEIFYHAMNSFVWSVSVENFDVEIAERITGPEIVYESQRPSSNISNRFFPTIAVAPVMQAFYTAEDRGGYFTPLHLGASQFINKTTNSFLKTTDLSGTFLTEDTNVHIGGRGLTKRDQPSLYDWEEQNQWIKEPFTSGQRAGSVQKNLTKTLQTFVPYQQESNETPFGLITPTSRTSPWGGQFGKEWTDKLNEPKSFTGVPNVPAWTEKQVLKQNEKSVDCWTTDIFGNQYGLFKNLTGVAVSDRKDISGELWTRTNNQIVQPANTSLSAVFELFKGDTTFFEQLTGSGIKSVDCFFDVLMLETSLSTVFIQVEYDYERAEINTVFDNIIKESNNDKRRYNQSWFFPQTKRLVSLFSVLSGTSFYPELTELNLNTRTYKRIFPSANIAQSIVSQEGLGLINTKSIDRGCIHYNTLQKSFLITYKCKDTNNDPFVVDFLVENKETLTLKDVTVYMDTSIERQTPTVDKSFFDTFVVPVCSVGTFSLTASNNPTGFEVINYVDSVSVNDQGTFSYFLSSVGLYDINYTVSNDAGSNQYCLTLSAI